MSEQADNKERLLQSVPEVQAEIDSENIGPLPPGACSNPTFHIPESNASDIAPSECSSHYRKGMNYSSQKFPASTFNYSRFTLSERRN